MGCEREVGGGVDLGVYHNLSDTLIFEWYPSGTYLGQDLYAPRP